MSSKTIIKLNPNPEDFGKTPDKLTAEMFDSPLPSQNTHSLYENDEIGLYVGVWDTSEMIEKAGPYICDEFMWILEGEVEIKNCRTGLKQKVKAGEAFVIPKGYHCQWHQTGYLRKFYLIAEHPDDDSSKQNAPQEIIKFEPTSATETKSSFDPINIKDQGCIRSNNISYKNCNGKFYTGSWSSDSFESELRSFPVNEIVHIVGGSLILTDDTGKQYLFVKGDAFFVPEGVICKWQSQEYIELIYAVLES